MISLLRGVFLVSAAIMSMSGNMGGAFWAMVVVYVLGELKDKV